MHGLRRGRVLVFPLVCLLLVALVTSVNLGGALTSSSLGLASTYPSTWLVTFGTLRDDYPWWGLELGDRGYVYVFGQSDYWKPLGYSSLVMSKISRYGENVKNVIIYGNGTLMGRDFKIINGVIYAVGQVTGYGAGGTDAYLLAFYENGTVASFTTYGSPQLDVFWRLAVGRNNTLYLAGYTMGLGAVKSDALITKVDLSGRILWSLVAGGPQYEYVWGVATWYDSTTDREYVIAVGQTNSFGAGGYDCLLIKLTEDGMVEWSLVFGTPALDRLDSVVVGDDGYIYVEGATYNTTTGNPDVLVAKISLGGEVSWITRFGGDGSDVPYATYVDKDYVYVVGATTSYFTGTQSNYDAFVSIIDKSSGALVSFVNFGGVDTDIAYAVKSDVNYVYVSGYTASFTEGGRDFFVAKMNKQYLLEEKPESLKWVYGDFPEDVNVSRVLIEPASFPVNTSSVYLTLNYLPPTTYSYRLLGSLVDVNTHIATTSGNPPAEITTTTEVSTVTTTATTTATRTVVDIITETLTTTETYTTTNLVTETTTYTTQETVTETETVEKTTTATTTRTETKTQTSEVTATRTETVTTSVPVVDVMTTLGVGVALLVVGAVLGLVLARAVFRK